MSPLLQQTNVCFFLEKNIGGYITCRQSCLFFLTRDNDIAYYRNWVYGRLNIDIIIDDLGFAIIYSLIMPEAVTSEEQMIATSLYKNQRLPFKIA